MLLSTLLGDSCVLEGARRVDGVHKVAHVGRGAVGLGSRADRRADNGRVVHCVLHLSGVGVRRVRLRVGDGGS